MEALEITFKIEVPHTDYQSDINTLILRIDKLRHFYKNIFFEEILQHMKFKEI